MELNSLLYSLGLSGMFSSRAFLPAFATSLALRYGDHLPFLNKVEFFQSTGSEPPWFASGYAVVALGVLSLLELIADKSPELRELMDDFSIYAKSIISGLTTFGLLSATDASFVEGVVSQAGFLDIVPAIMTGGVTYFFGTTRQNVLSILSEADVDDELGIRSFIGWCEELWASFGVWLLAIMIVPVLVLIGIAMGLMYLIRRRYERKQEEAKVDCASCGERIHSFATQCYHCNASVREPKRLGFLGRLSDEVTPDIESQKLRLLELKRSPKSGELVKERGVNVVCEVDGERLFGDSDLTRKYISMVGQRLPLVLLFGALLSLLPGIGLVFGVVYYRLKLVAPFRRYLPSGKGILVKWLIRLLFLALIVLQFVPIAGATVVPIMATVNFLFYRSAFKSELSKANLLPL